MQISKVATAVALSTGLLFGCNSDGLPIPTDGSTDPATPTSALLNGYWEFSDTAAFSAAYSSSSSDDLPNVYRFSADGETLYYYTDNSADTTLGEYERFETTYEETIEDETSGQVAFTLFNDDGTVSSVSVDGDYSAADGGLAIGGNIPVSGTDHSDNTEVTEATDTTDEAIDPSYGVTDDFDDYDANMQIDTQNDLYFAPNADNTTIIASVSDSVSNSPSKSLLLDDKSGDGKPVVSRAFIDGAAESGSVSVAVYIPTDGYVKSTYLYLGTSEDASSSARFTEVSFGKTEIKIRKEDGSTQDVLTKYEHNSWVDVTISWSPNQDGSNYDVAVTIDGVKYSGFTAENDSGAPSLFSMYVGDNSSTGTYSYFDDLDSALFEEDREDDGSGDGDGDGDGNIAQADFEWNFSDVDGGTALGKTLTTSKNDSNPKQVVDGAASTGGAVHITQSTDSGSYGYYYTTMDSTSDPLAFEDGTYSMEIVFSADDVNFNPGFSQDLQLLENTDSNKGYKLIIDKSSLKPKFRIYDGSGSTSVEAETVLTNDTFMHILATFNNGEAKLYINGVLEKEATGLTFVPNTKDGDKVYIGGGSNSSQKNLEGVIDNAAFFNDVLTADEVAARANYFGLSAE
ncbi:LamG-like jellyroll fold domain-containing protein [Vibrio splendidus]|uniref:LamG-like jellyroll fold domain-containing protein n=1 Tax=Vibrio splendidus TaxID=29497 RepID=UPI0002D99E51|nr:LamG-like jellyroll fold domain-containing protein [Vibrio splendidus]